MEKGILTFWQSCKILFRVTQYVSFFLLTLVSYPFPFFGKVLRKGLEYLGLVPTKIGQLVSGRYDLIKKESVQGELRKLLDRGKRLPDKTMINIIRNELGSKTHRLHNLKYLASPSVSQVYEAMLDGKKHVAVKVVKPGVQEQVELDFKIYLWLARTIERLFPSLHHWQILRTVSDFQLMVQDELDMVHERQNIELFRRHLGNYFPDGKVRDDLGKVVVPKTYHELSTGRVLTMEFLEGISGNDWLRGKRPASGQKFDLRKSILTWFVSAFRPLLRGEGETEKPVVFHGDPNFGSLIIMESGDIGVIDLGVIGHYSEQLMPGFRDMFFACFLKDALAFAEALLKFAGVADYVYDDIRANSEGLWDLLVNVEELLKGEKTGQGPIIEQGLGEMLKGLVKIFTKYDLPIPQQLPLMARSNLLFDSVAHAFCPELSTADMLREEFELAQSAKEDES